MGETPIETGAQGAVDPRERKTRGGTPSHSTAPLQLWNAAAHGARSGEGSSGAEEGR